MNRLFLLDVETIIYISYIFIYHFNHNHDILPSTKV